MICIKCKREIDRSYAAPGFAGNYCEPCAIAAVLTPRQMAQKQFERAGEMAAEAARSITRLTQTVKGFEDGIKAGSLSMNENRKAIRAEAITEFAERLKKYYNHLKGNTSAALAAYHIDQIKEEMLRGDSDDNT